MITYPTDPWVIALSGKRINPLAVEEAEIDVNELAHALSNINRFNGHTRYPVNVAQHSVYVSRICGNGIAGRQGLFHDGAEYLLGDITKWLKRTPEFALYCDAEERAQRTIYRRFGCPEEMLPEVKAADVLMVRVEAEWAWGPNWSPMPGYGPLTPEERAVVGDWEPWTWSLARWEFLKRYDEVAAT